MCGREDKAPQDDAKSFQEWTGFAIASSTSVSASSGRLIPRPESHKHIFI